MQGQAAGDSNDPVVEPEAAAPSGGGRGVAEVILSPDRKLAWIDEAWKQAVLSPDGRYAWTGGAWAPVAAPVGGMQRHLAWGGAVLLCGGLGTLVILLGNLAGPLKVLFDAMASTPLLFLHSVHEALSRNRSVLRGINLPEVAVGSLVATAGLRLHRGPTWIAGLVYGSGLAICDNLAGGLVVRASTLLAVLLPVAAPLVMGAVIGRREQTRWLRAALWAAYIGAFLNGLFAITTDSAAAVPVGSDPGAVMLAAVTLGGTIIFGLTALGRFVDARWIRKRQEPAAA